jgi:hypothetical protein
MGNTLPVREGLERYGIDQGDICAVQSFGIGNDLTHVVDGRRMRRLVLCVQGHTGPPLVPMTQHQIDLKMLAIGLAKGETFLGPHAPVLGQVRNQRSVDVSQSGMRNLFGRDEEGASSAATRDGI